MICKTKAFLRELARRFGLRIRYVCTLRPETHGKLLPRERLVLVNAHKPRHEHIFTILHELGHFELHVRRSSQMRYPFFLNWRWKSDRWNKVWSMWRRSARRWKYLHGKEVEADLWAFMMFLMLSRSCGCRAELVRFVEAHPEKNSMFLLASCALVRGAILSRLRRLRTCLAFAKA